MDNSEPSTAKNSKQEDEPHGRKGSQIVDRKVPKNSRASSASKKTPIGLTESGRAKKIELKSIRRDLSPVSLENARDMESIDPSALRATRKLLTPGKVHKFDNAKKYMLPLVEKIEKKGAGGSAHLICLVCLELGENSFYFSKDSGNMSKHHRGHITKLGDTKELRFERIEELQGTMFTFQSGSAQQTLPFEMVARTGPESPLQKYQRAIARMIVGLGLPMSLVEEDLFREMLTCRDKLSPGVDKTVGKQLLRSTTDLLWKEFVVSCTQLLERRQTRSFSLVFDGWDWGMANKITGVSMRVSSTDDLGNPKSEIIPIMFRLMKSEVESSNGDLQISSTLSTADSTADMILNELTMRNFPMTKLLNMTGDGANNAVNASVKVTARATGVGKHVRDITSRHAFEREAACLAHLAGNCGKGILDLLERGKKTTIPDPASKTVLDMVANVRAVCILLNKPTVHAQYNKMCEIFRLPYRTIRLDMQVRWTSTFEMLADALYSFQSIKKYVVNIDKECPECLRTFISHESFLLLSQCVAALTPLMDFIEFLDTTKFCLTPYVLPCLMLICGKYMVIDSERSLLFAPRDKDTKLWQEKKFERMDLVFVVCDQDGNSEKMKVWHMHPEIQNLVTMVIPEHMYYRFVHQRCNNNIVELVAMACNPCSAIFLPTLCTNVGVGDCFERTQEAIVELIALWTVNEKGSLDTGSSSDEESEVDKEMEVEADVGIVLLKRPRLVPATSQCQAQGDKLSISDQLVEMQSIDKQTLFSISSFIKRVKLFEESSWWTNPSKSRKWRGQCPKDYLPEVYEAALILNSTNPTSIFQESVFSTASAKLNSRRKRLLESPDRLEQLVVLGLVEKMKLNPNFNTEGTATWLEDAVLQHHEEYVVEKQEMNENEEKMLSSAFAKSSPSTTDNVVLIED